MHILANMRPKDCIKSRLIFSSKFVTFWGVTWGVTWVQGEWCPSVTWGRGSKISMFFVTYFLNGPKGPVKSPIEEAANPSNFLHTKKARICTIRLKYSLDARSITIKYL